MTKPHPLRGAVRRASASLAVALAIAMLGPALGADVAASATSGAAAPSRQTRGAFGRARARLATLQDEIVAGQRGLAQMQAHLSQLADEVGEGQATYARTQTQLTAARNALDAAQQRYEAIRQRLDERAVQALYLSSGPQMEFLLESKSFSEVSDRVAFLNQLQVADAALADQVRATAAGLAARRDELESTLRRQADIVAELLARQGDAAAAFGDEQRALREMAAARREATALVERIAARRERHRARAAAWLEGQLASIGGAIAPYGQWAQLFLREVGAPTCRDNLVAIITWQAAEGTSAAWNPLATTLALPGSTTFNSVGVQNYVSIGQGLDAIHQTLLRGASTYGYGAILDTLGSCADAMTTASAINASSWCRGCAGGAYVTGLIPAVEASFDRYAVDSAA
jgi:peptidoglycan hydrolase CwlO-like protein